MAIKSKRIGEQVDRNTLGRIRVLNNSGGAIAQGDILSVTGASASGGHLTVGIADADVGGVLTTGMKLVADHDIADGSTGIAVDWQILAIDTTATGDIAGAPGSGAGQLLFLSATGVTGTTLKMTLTAGTGNYIAVVGIVITSAVAGTVLLAPKKWNGA